jgi:hypothetical protein
MMGWREAVVLLSPFIVCAISLVDYWFFDKQEQGDDVVAPERPDTVTSFRELR